MKKLVVLLLMLMAALAAVAQTTTLSAGATPSPAERSMAQANRLIEKDPKNFEAYNALALALFRIDDDAVSVELLARRVGNDEGKARRVDDGGDCFVDLAICFPERDSSRDGLLDIGDRRESSGAPLELGDQLSRQRTPPSPGV